MCDSAFPYADRRYLIASNDYLFQPNTKTKIAMAFMATDTNGYACPITSFKPIIDLADTAWKIYWNPLPPLSSKELTAQHNSFKIYPNPAQTILHVQSMAKAQQDETIRVIDALGKTIALPITHRGNQYEINISALSTGVYSVLYYDGESLTAQRFVKE